MKYSLTKEEKYSLLSLDEDKLDSVIAPKIKGEFVTLFQAGVQNLVLDLQKVRYVDSSGLSAILVAHRLAAGAGGYLVLAGLSEHILKLITISRLDSVLNISPTVEEAVDAIFISELEKDLENESKE